VGATAVAQYPARQNNQPQGYQPLNYQTNGTWQPNSTWQQQTPAQSQQQKPPATAPSGPALPSASGGTAMYFHKPADGLIPVSGTGDPVAAAPAPPAPAGDNPSADFLPVPPLPVPAQSTSLPPIPDRAIRGTQGLPQVPVPALAGQPKPETGKGDQKPPANLDPNQYTVLPDSKTVFMMYDNAQLEKAIIEIVRKEWDIKGVDKSLRFPDETPVGEGSYVAKTVNYLPSQVAYDSLYIVHRRLHFEDKNTERSGWDMGIVQPFVSAMTFYKDFLFWPSHLASGFAYGFWDTDRGKCTPGSPTPYMLYPPGLTTTGSAFEAVIVTGAVFATVP
jgi:hypothetical protein